MMSDTLDDENVGVREVSPSLSASSVNEQSSLKRKRESSEVKTKRKRSKRKKSKKLDEDEEIDFEHGLNLALARFDSQLLADHIAKQSKRFAEDLTLLELEESRIPVKAIVDTTTYERDRGTENLADFLKHFSQDPKGTAKLSRAPLQNGSPHTLIITSSGLRAADLTRALRIFQTKAAVVAKLFAKHIKLQKAIEDAQRTRMGIGVGTPSRIADLLSKEALSTKYLARVVIDMSHIDQKKRGILDMKDTQPALMALLNKEELKSRYGQPGGIDLLFF